MMQEDPQKPANSSGGSGDPSGQYRERFYARYATAVQIQPRPVTPAEADAFFAVWSHYIRGWLPERKDAAILDAACGAGKFLRFFASRGYTNVRGVDISPEQVALARHLHPQVEQSGVVEYLNRHAGQFDLITCIDMIEHLTKNEILSFLDACHTALRPGGRLILQTVNGESPFRGDIWFGDFTHETCLTAKSMKQLMLVCGFSDYEVRDQPPIPHGLRSTVRALLWKLLRLALIAGSYIEVGNRGTGVLTRVFIASGVKR